MHEGNGDIRRDVTHGRGGGLDTPASRCAPDRMGWKRCQVSEKTSAEYTESELRLERMGSILMELYRKWLEAGKPTR